MNKYLKVLDEIESHLVKEFAAIRDFVKSDAFAILKPDEQQLMFFMKLKKAFDMEGFDPEGGAK